MWCSARQFVISAATLYQWNLALAGKYMQLNVRPGVYIDHLSVSDAKFQIKNLSVKFKSTLFLVTVSIRNFKLRLPYHTHTHTHKPFYPNPWSIYVSKFVVAIWWKFLDKGCYSACHRHRMLTDAAGVVFHIGIKTGDLTGLTYLTKLMAAFRNSLPTNWNTTCHPRNVFIYLFIYFLRD